MKRFRAPSPAMVIACIALSISLSGVGYAAVTIPRNSVGTVQLKKNAVNSAKVKNGSLVARDFRAGQLLAGPRGPAGPQGVKGATGRTGPQGVKGATGSTGPQGGEGATGRTGAQGLEGPAGPRGEQGASGTDGSPGLQGPEGPRGAEGQAGPAGPSGLATITRPTANLFTQPAGGGNTGFGTTSVICPNNSRVIGGGVEITTGFERGLVVSSHPYVNVGADSGWRIKVRNDNTGGMSAVAYAICVP